MGHQVRGMQSVRAHAKCAGPRKVRGLCYECAGRQVRGRARNAWAAVQLRGPHWVRGPQLRGDVSGPHCPCTCPAPAMQCPRNATAVPLAWAAMSRNRPARYGLIASLPNIHVFKEYCTTNKIIYNSPNGFIFVKNHAQKQRSQRLIAWINQWMDEWPNPSIRPLRHIPTLN